MDLRVQTENSQNLSPHHAAVAMRPILGIPGLRASSWHILNDQSINLSLATPIVKLSVVSSQFTITLKNVKFHKTCALRGVGGGASFGPGLLSIDVSGDPQQLSNLLSNIGFSRLNGLLKLIGAISSLPGSYSPIFLCPGRPDSIDSFTGAALALNAGAALGLEGGIGVVLFFDPHAFSNLLFQVAAMGAFGTFGGIVEAGIFAANVKAFAFIAGLDYCTNVSLGIQEVLYTVHRVSATA